MNIQRHRLSLRWLGIAMGACFLILVIFFAQVAIGQGPLGIYPPGKQTLFARVTQTIVAARKLPTLPPHTVTLLPPVYDPPFYPGEVIPAGAGYIDTESDQDSFPGEDYLITNSWYEWKGKTITRIYAGSYYRDPVTYADHSSQGILIEKQWTNNQPSGQMQVYPTPIQAGILRIIGAEGEQLFLQSKTGVRFTFDVPTHQYTIQ